MRNIKLILSYDGTAYYGWERQRDFPTLQQKLEEAIRSLTGEQVSVQASGRTDAGVHALGQVANFRTDSRHDPTTVQRALNAILPDDIRVLNAVDVDESFHATYAAKGKLYRYAMHDSPIMDPFLRRYVYHCNWSMDDRAMQRAAQCLIGTHDFSSFETAGATRQTSVRTITHVAVFRGGPERLWSRSSWTPSMLTVENATEPAPGTLPSSPRAAACPLLFLEVAADGFLYNMVRSIAGTLINVGRGYGPAEAVGEILQARDRTKAGPTAPPQGLFLVRVDY